LKNDRAAGPDGVPPELLKCAIGPVSRALRSLFIQVWRSGIVPADWQEGIIITLYKGKGPRTLCSNYRPITLLSVPDKVFAHVLLTRIQPLIDQSRLPQQSGFTAGRSTIDAILALRLLSELHREFNRPLNVAFLDIKSAFDKDTATVVNVCLCQFTGYDIGTALGQVSGCISNMYPSDGGHIQTERTHFVKGKCFFSLNL